MRNGTDSDGSPPPPPSRAGLKAWWKQFTIVQRVKKEAATKPDSPGHGTVFNVPLRESLKYASVQISTANSNGDLYVWGYIPVVVAKCGLYLKENATEVPGTFRVSGSSKRMRDLQNIFEKPPKYGKSLDWKKETYTTHDVASVFRRYLTQMPEPVIPHTLYHEFRDTMAKKPFDHDQAIKTYQRLIRSMPRANQYLLLYVLDLLSVFARKSAVNLMPASNLALIFRPGLISHPCHELSPEEHQLSLEVLEFLIAQQDYFMMDLSPPPLPTPPTLSPMSTSLLQSPTATPDGGPLAAAGLAQISRTPTIPVVTRDAEDDVYMVPSSSDEDPPEGGWKLVERRSERVQRRRTTSQSRARPIVDGPVQRRPTLSPVHSETSQTGPSSPVVASPTLGRKADGSIKRSRTVPSRKSGKSSSSKADTPPIEREREREAKDGKKVLSKKQKRLSHLPQPAEREFVQAPRAVEAPT